MSAKTASDGAADDRLPFDCDWRREGVGAASVRVSGELDVATSPELERMLREALVHARLVLLNMSDVAFMESSGLRVILSASKHAREKRARLLLVGVSPQVEALLEMTGTTDHVMVLRPGTAAEPLGAERGGLSRGPSLGRSENTPAADDVKRWIHPLDNPVNAIVLTARVMDVPDAGLWLLGSDGVVRRAWAPAAATGSAVPVGTPIEAYLDDRGEVNGWRDPSSYLAVNQRRFDMAASPEPGSALACQGACGLVWRAPAAAELAKHDERCLTCAGPLALS